MGSSAAKTEPRFGCTGLVGQGDPSPLALQGRAPTVVAVHGFAGTPLEVELVVQAAGQLGLAARAPLLPGHGTHAADLAACHYSDWLDALCALLESITGPLILAGLSLGSILTAEATLRYPSRVRALVLLANAMWLQAPFPQWPLRVIDRLGLPDVCVPKVTADIADPVARRSHLTYGSQPAHAAARVLRAGERVRTRLGAICCPTLVLHGALDRVCPARNARRVGARLGAPEHRVVIFPESRHIVTRDVEREAVRGELVAFFERMAPPAPG